MERKCRALACQNYACSAGYPLSEQLRVCSYILSNFLSGRPHQSQQLSYTALSSQATSCSFEFSCCSFIKHTPWAFCFPIVMGKNLHVFMSPIWEDLTKHSTFRFFILYSKLSKSVEFNLPSYLSQIVNFNGLTFLTALVVFNQITLLSHSNKDSDWLTIVCFMSIKHVDDTCVCF